MPPIPNPNAEAIAAASAAHAELIQRLDINHLPKPFRSPSWRPNQRRNKNIKTILGDATRKEASSLAATQENSGAVTPRDGEDSDATSTGTRTPENKRTQTQPDLNKATKNLNKLVLERNLNANRAAAFSGGAVGATYTNIESAPTLAPTKHYCDFTGLPAPYTDPKTRLRYADREVFGVVRGLGQGVAEMYLEARGAHTVLK